MATISDETKITLPVVIGIVTAVCTGSFGVAYLGQKMDQQDRRLARIEKRLGIDEYAEASQGEAVAAERNASVLRHR